jgi:hypothetical protein
MNRMVIEDWYMSKSMEFSETKIDAATGFEYNDVKKGQRHYKVIGTEDQINKWGSHLTEMVDEVYRYEPIEKGSHWDGIVCGERADRPSREEYNNKWRQTYDKYLKIYNENNQQLLIV